MSKWDAVIPTITDVRDTVSIGVGNTFTDYLVPDGKRWQICGFSAKCDGLAIGICTDVVLGVDDNTMYFITNAGANPNGPRGVIGPSSGLHKVRKRFSPFELIGGNSLWFGWYASGAGLHLYTAIIYKELPL